MLTATQIDAFDRDGFLTTGPLLSGAELSELTEELDRVIATGPDGFRDDERKPVLFCDIGSKVSEGPYSGDGTRDRHAPIWQIVNMWETSDAFERLMHHPAIVGAVAQLTRASELSIWHDQVVYKPPFSGGANSWHQDAPLWPTILPMTPVSAWIPFDDATLDNGCMWMVPGSHRWGNQMPYLSTRSKLKTLEEVPRVGEEFMQPDAKAVPRPVRRGEVSFHHSLTWHGSPLNTSPRPRRAIAVIYMTGDSVYQGKRGHPMERFIDLPPGAPMSQAGEHFPVVYRDGRPLEARQAIKSQNA